MDEKLSYSAALSSGPRSAPGAAYPNGDPDLLFNHPDERNGCDGSGPGNLPCQLICGSGGATRMRDARPQASREGAHPTLPQSRATFEFAKTITKPGIYFTGAIPPCNQPCSTTTIDKKPYQYE